MKRPKKLPFNAVLLVQVLFVTAPTYVVVAFINGQADPTQWGMTCRVLFVLGNFTIFMSLLEFWAKREIEIDEWDEAQKTRKSWQEKVEELQNKYK